MSPSVFKLALAAVALAALLWTAPRLAAGDDCKGCAQAFDSPRVSAGGFGTRRNTK